MARPALTEEQKRNIRRSIRAAAAKLHAENGMRDISARSIAETAGVSVGTIYSHFGNLTELMQSLWKQPARKMIQEMVEVAAATPDPEDRLRALFAVYIDFARSNWSVYKAAFMFVRPDDHKAPEKISREQDRMFSLFKGAVVEGQNRGEFRAGDPDQITQNIWSGVHGAIALPTNFHRLELDESEDRIDSMLELLFEWLKKT